MAEMNELLEEAEGQCGALSDELDTAVAAINALEGRASALYEHASRSATQVKGRLAALAGRMDAAEQALEGARQDAASDLDALAGQATTVRSSVTGLLDHVREQLTALQLQQTRLDEAMNGRMQGVSTDVNELAEKVQAAEDALAQELEEAGQAVDHFGKAVQGAQEALRAKQEELGGALDALESTARKKAGEWVGGIQGLLAGQTSAMVDLANRAIVNHNLTMDALKSAFATEARTQLAASIEPLQDNLERLGRTAGQQGGLLSAKAQEALSRVRGALPVLEELKTAFEQSRRLA